MRNKRTKLIIFNPLSANSGQHQFSPCNINVHSTPEVMRIKDMISPKLNFLDILPTSPQYFYKKSMRTRWENLFFDISS